MNRTPGEIARAIEIVLSHCTMDRDTDRVLRHHLEVNRQLVRAAIERMVGQSDE